jgi:endo-1,4-beta-xylanase
MYNGMMINLHIPELSNKLLVPVGIFFIAIGISTGVAAHASHRTATLAVSGPGVDLLQQNWHYMDGVTQTGNTLAVAATDSKIVNQDGTGGQPNPAVNIYGTHLKTTGDFAVTAHLTDRTNATASLRLYNKPPTISDEFRIEPASIVVVEHGSTLSVKVWDGSDPQDATNPQPSFTSDAELTSPDSDVVISRSGSNLTVQAGDTTIAVQKNGKLFSSGAVWFGLSSPDNGFTVDKLSASGLNGATVSAVDASTPLATAAVASSGLQALATAVRPGFTVGTAVALGPWVSDATYSSQLTQNFGSITLENALKPQFISPRQGVYTFQEADALIALAHANGMTVHGHTLAFSEANPAWMRNLPTATAADRQATTAILLDYVSHVVTHFKGQLSSLDVINEPLDTDQGTSLQQNIWYKAMGPDYMVRVSQAVHAIDPDIKQFVNENGAEMSGDRQDALLALIQHINAQGGFIYGVGLQAHVYDMDTDAIDAGELNTTFDRFGAAGLKVRISENDVTDDSGITAQTAQYATIFATCLHNTNCVSYSTWGFNDRYDWFIDDDGSLQQGSDLLFNGGKVTGAYTAIQKLLQ